MKIIRTLDTTAETMNRFLQHLADQDAGQTAYSGLSYTKSVPGMNGKNMECTTTIQRIEPGHYSVVFEGQNGRTEMIYSYHEETPGKTVLEYEENASGDNISQKFMQKLNSVMFSGLIKKQINLRMDNFEKALAEFSSAEQ